MTTARAFWITGRAKGEIREVPLAAPGAGEVLVETLYSAISRGTEALVFNGQVPASEHDRMRAPFQDGEFPAPVKYGYINVGRVAEGASDLLGRTIFCLYPHQTRYVVPAGAVTVVPENVPAGRAVLAAGLETAVNALWDARPQIGDRIAVIGAGTIGCLCAWLAGRIAGAEVELIDVDPGKADVAGRLGVDFSSPDQTTRDADVVIHASGSATGLATALALAGFEAAIIELSWHGDRDVGLPLGQEFHGKRLQLRSSQVSHVATDQRARWDHARRMRLVMRLLESPELDALITDESAFDELPATMARLAGPEGSVICHRIVYS